MTIKSATTIKKVILAEGLMEGRPTASVWSYKSAFDDKEQFAVFLDHAHCDIYQSPFVQNPVLLMEDGEATEEGKRFASA